MSIFTSIASFCDSELIPTLDNLIENAKNPNSLRTMGIGIFNSYCSRHWWHL